MMLDFDLAVQKAQEEKDKDESAVSKDRKSNPKL
jgi:hypothetical protein